jgi:hypothetical protein
MIRGDEPNSPAYHLRQDALEDDMSHYDKRTAIGWSSLLPVLWN